MFIVAMSLMLHCVAHFLKLFHNFAHRISETVVNKKHIHVNISNFRLFHNISKRCRYCVNEFKTTIDAIRHCLQYHPFKQASILTQRRKGVFAPVTYNVSGTIQRIFNIHRSRSHMGRVLSITRIYSYFCPKYSYFFYSLLI